MQRQFALVERMEVALLSHSPAALEIFMRLYTLRPKYYVLIMYYNVVWLKVLQPSAIFYMPNRVLM